MVHKKICIFLLFLVILLSSLSSPCQANENNSVSGIVKGQRILNLVKGGVTVDFTVYRGDYIKFKFHHDLGSLHLTIPALNLKKTILPDPSLSPYFKMTSTGIFPFTVGTFSGKIRVIDLIQPDYHELSADQAAELLLNSDPFVLDVRTRAEHTVVYIPGSHLIPIQELQSRIPELKEQVKGSIFIYCSTGNRSTVASQILADRDFEQIFNLRHGIVDWERKGFPVSHNTF